MTELDPLRRCERINDELELHYWPVPDPPPGTACTCGKTTRRAAGEQGERRMRWLPALGPS